MTIQNTIVQICITLILVGSSFVYASDENITNDDITKVVNNICDYEDLCLSNALDGNPSRRQKTSAKNIIRQADNKCCQPCLCTTNCVHENCCPGAIRHPTLHATCRAQNDVFNVPRGLRESDTAQIEHSDYFIVDTCPENAPEDLQRSCVEPKALEDHVFVSSSDNSVIFKNAKCAKCNEVFSYRIWKQILYNKKAEYPNFNTRFNSSPIKNLANTHAFSLPLKEDSHILAAHKCVTKANSQRICPAKTMDTDLADKCLSMEGRLFTTNGLTFPNTFCFACQNIVLVRNYPEKVCRYIEENRFLRKRYPLVVIVNYESPAQDALENGDRACESGDIQNPITVSTGETNSIEYLSFSVFVTLEDCFYFFKPNLLLSQIHLFTEFFLNIINILIRHKIC